MHSLRAKQRSGQLCGLGDERGMARILLECSLSDKLCGKDRHQRCLSSDSRMTETKVCIDSRRKMSLLLVEMKTVSIKEWALGVIVFEEGQVPVRDPEATSFILHHLSRKNER